MNKTKELAICITSANKLLKLTWKLWLNKPKPLPPSPQLHFFLPNLKVKVKVKVINQLKVMVRNQPKVMVRNQPKVMVRNQPEVMVRNQPEVMVRNQPKVMVRNQPPKVMVRNHKDQTAKMPAKIRNLTSVLSASRTGVVTTRMLVLNSLRKMLRKP
jgi:hypothetical protein